MAKKQGISLKGKQFKWGNDIYEVKHMEGVPFKNHKTICCVYKNGEYYKRVSLEAVVEMFNITV